MNAHVRAQALLDARDQQPAYVVHVHVSQDHIGDGPERDAGGLESLGQDRQGLH